jgi:serine/threonine protein kinase
VTTDPLPEKFGRFRVIGELGRGAMGVVYRASDPALGRTVAIKTIALTGSSQERDTHEQRFLQEGRAAGGMSHPAIVTIYDVGREGDVAFIAMELVEGRDLRELIGNVSLKPAQSVAIAASVAEALAYAHERGVVHRDVKPGNIMVLSEDRVKIMDFGIAHMHEPMVKTQTGVMLGSPQYMSPEQITGQEIDHRADIFSLGLVLYEMLTGVKPFQGEDIPDLMFKVANMPATPPSHLAPDLPAVIDYIVARALKKKPDERYASAKDLARDLRECLAEVAASAPNVVASGAAGENWIAASGAEGSIEVTRPEPGRLPTPEEPLELRPSPRFDSKRALARLAMLPAETEKNTSRAGWTMPVRREPKRLDLPRALLVSAYVLAAFAALAIILW